MVAADAAGGDDHGLRGVLEVADLVAVGRPAAVDAVVGASTAPRTPVTAPPATTRSSTRCRNRERDQPARDAPRGPGARTARPRPGPVPQVRWKRGTELPCPSARPSPRSAQPTTGKSRSPMVVQPRPLLAGREVDVRLGPAAAASGPLAVELGAAHPVLQRQLVGVLDAHPALLGACRRGTARRATRTPGRRGDCSRLLVEQEHLLARVGELGGGDQPGQAGSDDDDVCVHAWILPQIRMLRPGQTRPPVVEPDSRCDR